MAHINSATPLTPVVGMGATLVQWTDRTACTIITVSASGNKIMVQEDHALRTDGNGMSDCQSYSYTPNPNGRITVARLNKDGRYRTAGKGSNSIAIGVRRSYHDYSF